jgi:hypothetical protein
MVLGIDNVGITTQAPKFSITAPSGTNQGLESIVQWGAKQHDLPKPSVNVGVDELMQGYRKQGLGGTQTQIHDLYNGMDDAPILNPDDHQQKINDIQGFQRDNLIRRDRVNRRRDRGAMTDDMREEWSKELKPQGPPPLPPIDSVPKTPPNFGEYNNNINIDDGELPPPPPSKLTKPTRTQKSNYKQNRGKVDESMLTGSEMDDQRSNLEDGLKKRRSKEVEISITNSQEPKQDQDKDKSKRRSSRGDINI